MQQHVYAMRGDEVDETAGMWHLTRMRGDELALIANEDEWLQPHRLHRFKKKKKTDVMVVCVFVSGVFFFFCMNEIGFLAFPSFLWTFAATLQMRKLASHNVRVDGEAPWRGESTH
jgi:hypothetical protein